MGNPKPNTKGIVEYKKRESEQKKNAVLSVLNQLIALNKPITKHEICRRAAVSKTFLYSFQDDLLKPINEAIIHQNNKIRVEAENKRISEKSQNALIQSMKRRIRKLEEENVRLKEENAILLGHLARR
ncbi:DUF6262 family protein [Desnuesiella massiliensis]|uniref:DUF6262 family protein n=1 Tax=Desnuesiella massiliensis TaxID=1650662 RepID=UPI0006E40C17|nr:DUF6262 family protein [Desnuesiella massiliensis]